MSYLMSTQLGQQVINYLGTKPYREVSDLVQGMKMMNDIDDDKYNQFLAAEAKKAKAEKAKAALAAAKKTDKPEGKE